MASAAAAVSLVGSSVSLRRVSGAFGAPRRRVAAPSRQARCQLANGSDSTRGLRVGPQLRQFKEVCQTAIERLAPPLQAAAPFALPALLTPMLPGVDLAGPGSVLEAVAVLATIIAVHECGHLYAARSRGIHVTKFALGFGPKLLSFKPDTVEYSLRLIPLGGYVAFPDEDPDSTIPPDDPNLLRNRPLLDRAWVVSAGVIFNFIFAFFVLTTQACTTGMVKQTLLPGVSVPGLVEGPSRAREAGLHKGDLIVAINGETVNNDPGAVNAVADRIRNSPEHRITLSVQRNGEVVDLGVVPELSADGSGRIGVQLVSHMDTERTVARSPRVAIGMASKEFSRLFNVVVSGLQQIVFNFSQTAERVSGPVAILAAGAEVARNEPPGLYQFAAIVNINLAVVNMLPLPALDGGFLFLMLIEAIRGGKRLPQEVEAVVMSSGLVLLLGLGMVLVVRDTLNLDFVKALL
eukprot:jgi/Chlat1/157/Chrsp1S03240